MIIGKIILKDLKIMLSDKKALAILILMPIILTTILSIALKSTFISGNDSNFKVVNIAVVKLYDETEDNLAFKDNLSNSFLVSEMDKDTLKNLTESSNDVNPESMFFYEFLESKDVTKFINYTVVDEEKAMELLSREDISAIVFLPHKFIYDMKINFLTPFRNEVHIKIVKHPDKNIDGQIVEAALKAYTDTISSIIIGKNVIIETAISNNLDDDGLSNIDDIIENISNLMESVDVKINDVIINEKTPIRSSDYYSVAMMTMFILFSASQGGRMLLEEKDNQTYQRMIVAGTTKFELLSGKFFTVFILALLQIVIMIVYTHFALDVNWGNLTSVSLISISSSLAVAGLGSFVGALTYRAGNYKMANIFETAIIQGMAILGGNFFPLDIMPKFMQQLSFLSLNGTALKAYLKVIKGDELVEVVNYIFILAISGVVFTLLAVLDLKKKEVNNNVNHNKVKTSKA